MYLLGPSRTLISSYCSAVSGKCFDGLKYSSSFILSTTAAKASTTTAMTTAAIETTEATESPASIEGMDAACAGGILFFAK